MPKEPNVEKLRMVEKKIESEQTPQAIDGNVTKSDKILLSQRRKSKSLLHFQKDLRRRKIIQNSRNSLLNLAIFWLTLYY